MPTQEHHTLDKKTSSKKKSPIAKKAKVDHSKKLGIALTISLLVIILLLIKDFMK